MSSHSKNGYSSNVVGSSSAADAESGGAAALNYEDSDLNAITRSQTSEDLIAYRYDLDFCQTQLTAQENLTPQEIRTLQIRVLDCCHNIRHCKHRIQTLDAQARFGIAPYSNGAVGISGSGAGTYRSGGTAAVTNKNKRQRIVSRKSDGAEVDDAANGNGDSTITTGTTAMEVDADGADNSIVAAGTEADITTASAGTREHNHPIQRLGYWDCRLCRSRKYLEAGPNRVPSAPVSIVMHSTY
jgi:hypothetical protein